MSTQTWQSEAACTGQTDLFFPTYERKDHMQKAKDICNGCPVKKQCLEEHMGERHGVFGGTTPYERKQMGGANNPLPVDFMFDANGNVIDEGVPEPLEKGDFTLRFDPKTADGKRTIRKIIDLYAGGLSAYKVAEQLDMNVNTVKNYLRRAGVQRTISEAKAVKAEQREKLKAEAVKLYTSGLGIKAVADRMEGITKFTVRRMAIEAGVFRTPEEQKQVQKEQMRKRELNPSDETVLIVKYIKESGLNPSAIARTLNVDKYKVYNLKKSVEKGVY